MYTCTHAHTHIFSCAGLPEQYEAQIEKWLNYLCHVMVLYDFVMIKGEEEEKKCKKKSNANSNWYMILTFFATSFFVPCVLCVSVDSLCSV